MATFFDFAVICIRLSTSSLALTRLWPARSIPLQEILQAFRDYEAGLFHNKENPFW